MLHVRKRIREEKGSATFEFLMVMPYYLFFFLFLWQAVASGLTILQAQSAANEAAKIYAVTKNQTEALEYAKEAIGDSEIMKFIDFDINPIEGETDPRIFEATVTLEHGLVFVPEEWRREVSVNLSRSAAGREIE